jgi:hypothetical protein
VKRLGCTTALLAMLSAHAAGAQEIPADSAATLQPPVYEASYLAEAMGLSATARRVQTRSEDGLYTLENSLSLTLLGATVGTVIETSAFRLQDERVIPEHYHYSQTGLSAREETVAFDWQAMSARSSRDTESWSLPLSRGMQDRQSLSQEIAQQLGSQRGTRMRFHVVDGNEVEEHVYRLEGEQVLQTPVGALQTLRLQRVRSAHSGRRTTIWLASDWHHVLVQLEDVSASGRMTRLSLQTAKVNGRTLEGM